MSEIAVCLLTYNREKYALATLHGLRHLICNNHNLSLHIADDGTEDPQYINKLVDAAIEVQDWNAITNSNSERGGYGRNYNLATQVVHKADYILWLEDDWELTRALDLDDLVATMDAHEPYIGCLRMGYLGFTDQLWGTVMKFDKHIWMYLDSASPEKHVFAGHPRLEARWWSQRLGVWPEGINPGQTELAVCGRAAARTGVVWPMDLVKPGPDDLWAHIGTVQSY